MKIILVMMIFLLSCSLASAISVDDFSLADLGFTGFVVEANLDVAGSSQVLYGKTGALGSATSLSSSSNEHLLQVDGLAENTVYFYRVVGRDSSGNSYSSAISLTRTAGNIDVAPSGDASAPKITSIEVIERNSDSFKIRWYLDEGATGQIQYGTTLSFGKTSTFEPGLLPRHTQWVSGLQPGTAYYYRIVGEDKARNKYSSSINIITTIGIPPTNTQPTPTPDPLPPPSASSSKVNAMKSKFDAAWSKEKTRYEDMSKQGHQGDIYYWFAGFDGNVAIFQATGDTKYLDKAISLVDTLFSTALPANQIPTSKLPKYTSVEKTTLPDFTDTYLSWDNHGDRVSSQGGTDGGQASLYEGHGLRQVPKLLWILDNSPKLRAAGYQDDYNRLKAFYEKHVWDKWMTRGSSQIYRSRTHMASHWSNAAMYMYEIEDNSAKKKEYETVWKNYNLDMNKGDSRYPAGYGLRDQLRSHPKVLGGYVWDGSWGGSGSNDHSHANAEVNYMINGHELGYEWTDNDMAALQKTFSSVIFVGSGRTSPFYISGDRGGDRSYYDHGWSMLGRFDADLQNRLINRDMGQSIGSKYQSTFWGNMAYNEAYLDNNVKYPENYYQKYG